ncbi:MAG: bstEII [Verrucomicrobia bacterium]|nr:bstEII [Verrucomicrobiota bacterium]
MPAGKPKKLATFADYKADAANWITLATGEYYPDILNDACELYKPVLVLFGQLLKSSESATRLFLQIAEQSDGWMRIQLARVFRKYVSPETPVEMLKQKSKAQRICDQFGKGFRPIPKVQVAFSSRPIPDEALCAVLWEYKDRGKKGYDLTERFFSMFRSAFPNLPIKGPERAGKDILLGEIFERYPKPGRAVDFVIYDKPESEILAIGLARYDSDRGGAQEDDRTGGYRNCADEILDYARKRSLRTKVIFINHGPGLLLGSMWDDYAALEHSRPDRIMVATLRMVPERITREWLKS